MTLEFDSGAAHEACAPLHWDAEEWDFRAWSKDDESLTDGELEDEETTMMSLGMGTTPPQERRKTTSQLRRTRRQGVSCAPGRPMKMTAGTATTVLIVMMAPPVTTVLEMMVATGAAATVMSVQVLRSSTVGS
jgi:hypothetical protein